MFKIDKTITLQVLSVLIAISSLIASLVGVIFPGIYKTFVLDKKMPFVFAQDLISLVAALFLLVITFFRKEEKIKLNIIHIGIVWYLFYAYGPYVMGTLYNYFYFLYLAVLSLSIFYFIIAFTCIQYERLKFNMPKSLRVIVAIFCAAITIFFVPQWIIAIFHNIETNSRPTSFAFNYYVYILDLCFLLPVCALAAVLLFRKKNMGFLLGGILLIKGFTLMFSVALGFYCQPFFHQNMVVAGGAVLFTIISFACLVLSFFYFIFTKVTIMDLKISTDFQK